MPKVIACSLPILKIPVSFQFGVYLQSLVLNQATTHSRTLCLSPTKYLNYRLQSKLV